MNILLDSHPCDLESCLSREKIFSLIDELKGQVSLEVWNYLNFKFRYPNLFSLTLTQLDEPEEEMVDSELVDISLDIPNSPVEKLNKWEKELNDPDFYKKVVSIRTLNFKKLLKQIGGYIMFKDNNYMFNPLNEEQKILAKNFVLYLSQRFYNQPTISIQCDMCFKKLQDDQERKSGCCFVCNLVYDICANCVFRLEKDQAFLGKSLNIDKVCPAHNLRICYTKNLKNKNCEYCDFKAEIKAADLILKKKVLVCVACLHSDIHPLF